jgi:hypothetical protein
MKKLSLAVLFISVVSLLAACTKENVTPAKSKTGQPTAHSNGALVSPPDTSNGGGQEPPKLPPQ